MIVKRYNQTFAIQLFILFISTQLVIAGGMYAWLLYALGGLSDENLFIQAVIPLLILEVIAAVIIVLVVRRPLRKIDDALSYTYSHAGAKEELSHSLSGLIKSIRHLDAHVSPRDAVSTQHEFAQSLLDHLPIGVVALDQKRQITYANKAAPLHGGGKELNLRFKERESLEDWLDIVADKDISGHKWWRRLSQNVIENEEKRRFYDCLAIYQQSGSDSIETIIVTIDRSDQYSNDEDELDFMALASHELRGPVTVIRGYVDVLKTELNKTLSDDQRAFFERLDVSADRLSTYINNILNVSRFDRRHLQLNLKEDTFEKIYGSVRDDMELRARTQHRLLNVNLPKDLPSIAADRESVCEVIINLIDNAIKYSSEGGVIVASAKSDGDFVEFSVQDSGIGIPASLIGHLFEKFYRSHRSRDSTVGTGLGLYIAKAIIESHGGSIEVRSEEGHGSVFSFRLPTYASVADKLLSGNNSNAELITPKKYIKNHSLYRG